MTTYNESIENIGLTLQQIISDNMLFALAARRLNRAQLAAGIGVSGGLISQKLNGRTNWTIEDMGKAGRYLGIEPAWFLRRCGAMLSMVICPICARPVSGPRA